jgi:hypothetical protein
LYEVRGEIREEVCLIQPILEAWVDRSLTCEAELSVGEYEVVPRITATKDHSSRKIIDVVEEMANRNPQKLRQVGLNFDMSHMKPGLVKEAIKPIAPDVLMGQAAFITLDEPATLASQDRVSTDQPAAPASQVLDTIRPPAIPGPGPLQEERVPPRQLVGELSNEIPANEPLVMPGNANEHAHVNSAQSQQQ